MKSAAGLDESGSERWIANLWDYLEEAGVPRRRRAAPPNAKIEVADPGSRNAGDISTRVVGGLNNLAYCVRGWKCVIYN